MYDSVEDINTVVEEIVDEVSPSSNPYNYKEYGGVSIGASRYDDEGNNHRPKISLLSMPPK